MATDLTERGRGQAIAPADWQSVARRHLWMHFTRMGAYGPAPSSPSSSAARAATSSTTAAGATSTGWRRCSASTVGHGRTELADAAAAQLRELAFYTNWSYAHPRAIELAARVAALAPPGPRTASSSPRAGRRPSSPRWKLARAYHRLTVSSPAHEDRRARARLPRRDARRACGDRPGRAEDAVCARHPRWLPRREHEPLPRAGGRRPALDGRCDRAADHRRGPRDGRRGDPRAGPERGRLLHAAGGLLPARARDLRPPRRAADLRRGDLLLGTPRVHVRLRALRLRAGHHHDRQGDDVGLHADGRGDRRRSRRGAIHAGQRVVRARLHVRRAPRRRGGRAGEHRPHGARGHLRPCARQRGRVPRDAREPRRHRDRR